jgi:hypothetical protein
MCLEAPILCEILLVTDECSAPPWLALKTWGTGRKRLTLRSRRPCIAFFALPALWSGWPLCSRKPRRAVFTLRSSWSRRALRPCGALRSSSSLRPRDIPQARRLPLEQWP